jgi:hypothetical protein
METLFASPADLIAAFLRLVARARRLRNFSGAPPSELTVEIACTRFSIHLEMEIEIAAPAAGTPFAPCACCVGTEPT